MNSSKVGAVKSDSGVANDIFLNSSLFFLGGPNISQLFKKSGMKNWRFTTSVDNLRCVAKYPIYNN